MGRLEQSDYSLCMIQLLYTERAADTKPLPGIHSSSTKEGFKVVVTVCLCADASEQLAKGATAPLQGVFVDI